MQQHACRRKQRQMQARLEELGTESLEERLQMATEMPSPTPYRLSTLIQVGLPWSGCWQGTQLLQQQLPHSLDMVLTNLQPSPDCCGHWQPVCSAVLILALRTYAVPVLQPVMQSASLPYTAPRALT